jgi:UDP-glucose 4-epimerase
MTAETKNKNVVVTGGAGFLGSHVVQLLIDSNYNVTVLDDFSNGKSLHLESFSNSPNLKVIRGDVTNRNDVIKTFKGCHMVIHLAVLCLRQSIKEPQRVNEVIVQGTLNCLEIARQNQVELFLNCSSSEVYGSANHVPMDEQHPLHPETPYAAAKVAQDMYVSSYGRTYGLPWTTIRPFNMYGPHSHWQGHRGELIPKMIVRAMNKKPLVVFGNGSQTRDFTFVRDAAKAIVAIIKEPNSRNNSLNFCSGSETSIQQIAELICDFFDLDPKIYIKTQAPRPGDVQRHFGDNSKFEKLVGFLPSIDIKEGIRQTIEWFQSLPFSPQELISQEKTRNWE